MKVKTSKRISLRTINTVMLRCSVVVYVENYPFVGHLFYDNAVQEGINDKVANNQRQ